LARYRRNKIMAKALKLTTETSRRLLLQGAAALGGAIPFIAAGALAAGKMSQAVVAYQDSPKGTQNCANCNLFEKPSGCKLVEGPVSPNGWCRIWRPSD
jgi:hypothetical protein